MFLKLRKLPDALMSNPIPSHRFSSFKIGVKNPIFPELAEFEASMEATHLLFQTLFEASPDALVVVNSEGQIILVNRQTEKAFGYTCAELIGHSIECLVPERSRDNHLQQRKYYQEEAPELRRMGAGSELFARRKDGGEFQIDILLSPVNSGNGTLVLAAIRDITERTTELKAAIQELRAVNSELDSFSYAVSHDLRAPLRAISGFTLALVEDLGDKLSDSVRVDLEQIKIANQRMAELIDGLLVLSRATRTELRHDMIDLSHMAINIFNEFLHTYPQRKIIWEVESGLTMRGDAPMIEAAMRNLLENAWKFTLHTSQPSIRVYAEEKDGNRFLCVADNGAGFDMAYAGKLFQPFQRLHRQEEFPGTGIGLATVFRIMQRHGCIMKAEGVPGKGATFCFSLSSADDTKDPT
jgi:PAS domain S-box-containing protein